MSSFIHEEYPNRIPACPCIPGGADVRWSKRLYGWICVECGEVVYADAEPLDDADWDGDYDVVNDR